MSLSSQLSEEILTGEIFQFLKIRFLLPILKNMSLDTTLIKEFLLSFYVNSTQVTVSSISAETGWLSLTEYWLKVYHINDEL